MGITAIQQKILADDTFVLEEVAKLQYACQLKKVIRYELVRSETDFSESVAEHSHSMQIIADYFLRVEPTAATLDRTLVKTMITWHDMDEIETGDKISWKKTAADLADELTAWKKSLQHIPEVLRYDIATAVESYEKRDTPEGIFVKAVDKIEPLFHLFNEQGRQWIQSTNMCFEDSETIKIKFIKPFPLMKRFMDVIHSEMQKQKFFVK